MVPTTFSPIALTASIPSADVQCSSTILSLGYFSASPFITGRNLISAFMTVTLSAELQGASPCRFNTMPSSSMAVNTSWNGSNDTTPHSELVVAPRG
jgi:hypothetical protein